MSLTTRIESLVIRVAQEFNDVRAKTGNLANLTTTDKSSLVAALNELKAAVVSASAIDDQNIASSSTYSSSKIVTLLDALKGEILGGADKGGPGAGGDVADGFTTGHLHRFRCIAPGLQALAIAFADLAGEQAFPLAVRDFLEAVVEHELRGARLAERKLGGAARTRQRRGDRTIDAYFAQAFAQGRGLGEALIRRLLGGRGEQHVLLSTPEINGEANRAWRLYRRLGFTDIIRGYHFAGDPRAFAILGRSLPL